MNQVILKDQGRLHLVVRDRIKNMLIKSGARRGDALPTYRELSRQLKVSLVTVQKAMNELNAEGLISGRPGRGTFLAQDMDRSRRTITQIGIVFYCSRQLFFTSDYMMEMFRGVMLESEQLGADARIFSIKSEGVLDPAELAESGVDGLILCAVANDDYLRRFADQDIPTVVMDYAAADVPLDYVVVDNFACARRAVDHLVGHGHRRIGYVNGFSTDTVLGKQLGLDGDPEIESSDVVERREGFLAAMKAHGLSEAAEVYPARYWQDRPTLEVLAEHLTRDAAPTAIVTYDAGSVPKLANHLRDAGLRVPQDVSLFGLVGTGNVVAGQQVITHHRMDFIKMGREAVRRLAARCRDGRIDESQISRLDATYVEGATTGTCRTVAQ